jgi:hypothetical protein
VRKVVIFLRNLNSWIPVTKYCLRQTIDILLEKDVIECYLGKNNLRIKLSILIALSFEKRYLHYIIISTSVYFLTYLGYH